MRHYKFKYYQDPSHGWIAVKRALLDHYNLTHMISDYSYQDGGMVYLEEDRDAGILLNKMKVLGFEVELNVVNSDYASRVRNKEQFKHITTEETF